VAKNEEQFSKALLPGYNGKKPRCLFGFFLVGYSRGSRGVLKKYSCDP
jgi:hypothetical protein